MHEIGADELGGPELRVEHEQHHDDDRAGADRRHADDQAAGGSNEDRGHRSDHQRRLPVRGTTERRRAAPQVQNGPHDHRHHGEEQRDPERHLDAILDRRAVAELAQKEDTQEGGGDGTHHEPLRQ